MGPTARTPVACALMGVALALSGGLLSAAPAGAQASALRPGQGDARTLLRDPDRLKPSPAPVALAGLVGEYADSRDTVIVLERRGQLFGLDGGTERLLTPSQFDRDAGRRGTALRLGNRVFPRRPIGTDEGVTFRVTPIRPVEDLRRAALAAIPPAEGGQHRPSDLAEVTRLEPGIRLDIRYATSNNFLGAPMYSSARAFLQRPAAAALARVHRALAAYGYGLLVHDAYRPWYVTRMFWDATTGADHEFVADPASGSRHNRGAAVDLTLCDRETGKPVRMTGGYDEFSRRSYAAYPGGTSLERWRRDLLRRQMESQGFAVNSSEWWHFDFQGWREYPLLNEPFERLR